MFGRHPCTRFAIVVATVLAFAGVSVAASAAPMQQGDTVSAVAHAKSGKKHKGKGKKAKKDHKGKKKHAGKKGKTTAG